MTSYRATLRFSFAKEVGHRRFEVIKVLVDRDDEVTQDQPVMIVLPIESNESLNPDPITLKTPRSGFISSIVPSGTITSTPDSIVMSITVNKTMTNPCPPLPERATTQVERAPSNKLLTTNEAKAIHELQTRLENISSRLDQEVIQKESWTVTGDTKKALAIWLGLCAIAFFAGGEKWGWLAVALGFMYVFIPLACGTKTNSELRRSRYRERTSEETRISSEINAIKNEAYVRRRKEIFHWEQLKGRELEEEVAKLLHLTMQLDMEVTKGSGDEGIDLVGYRNGSVAVVCQVKGWAKQVGQPIVREFLGSSQKYSSEVQRMLIGTGGFSTPAIRFADEHQIDLLTANDLVRLAKD